VKIFGFIALFVFSILGALVLAGQIGLLRGKTPNDLGVREGRLKRPSLTPNSVSSQANLYRDHPQKEGALIAPLQYSGDPQRAMKRLIEVIKHLERTAIITQEPGYVYAQTTSQVLKFTDDMEFWLDKDAGAIQVRSASRLGRKDFNVNRERIEKIRTQFAKN
jgi:uncharacterized protein (DUF1499 family)